MPQIQLLNNPRFAVAAFPSVASGLDRRRATKGSASLHERPTAGRPHHEASSGIDPVLRRGKFIRGGESRRAERAKVQCLDWIGILVWANRGARSDCLYEAVKIGAFMMDGSADTAGAAAASPPSIWKAECRCRQAHGLEHDPGGTHAAITPARAAALARIAKGGLADRSARGPYRRARRADRRLSGLSVPPGGRRRSLTRFGNSGL